MFNRVAKNYDLVNLLITFGGVYFWRKLALWGLPKINKALDVATGTGAFIPQLKKVSNEVTGIDFSKEMLNIAKERFPSVLFYEGDALNLPFSDKSFELVTVGFGVRNFQDLEKGLLEIKRVLKGTLVILESGPAQNFIGKVIAKIHAGFWVPLIAKLFSSDPNAYNYLLDSTDNFYSSSELKEILTKLGFEEVKLKSLAFGNINILWARSS
mgnify:CR=1 FL=1